MTSALVDRRKYLWASSRNCSESFQEASIFCTVAQIPLLACKLIVITCSSSRPSRPRFWLGGSNGLRSDSLTVRMPAFMSRPNLTQSALQEETEAE